MDDESQLQSAKEAVLRFAQAWTTWEIQMATKGKESLYDPAMKQAHAALIADHCTAKKRAYVDGLPHYSKPPKYADVVEGNIINAELFAPDKACIDVKCAAIFYRFVVHRKRDGWRIESMKWKIIEKDDWKNGLIGM